MYDSIGLGFDLCTLAQDPNNTEKGVEAQPLASLWCSSTQLALYRVHPGERMK